jgi:hypothetical protein
MPLSTCNQRSEGHSFFARFQTIRRGGNCRRAGTECRACHVRPLGLGEAQGTNHNDRVEGMETVSRGSWMRRARAAGTNGGGARARHDGPNAPVRTSVLHNPVRPDAPRPTCCPTLHLDSRPA